MSKIIASAAIRGAHKITKQAEDMLARAIAEKGKDCRVEFPNTGYFLLATIVSRVTEKPFPEWAKENIFDPLGMNDTQILSRTGVVLDDLASSYVRVGEGQYFNQGFNLASNGSSSLISTLDDMVKWILNFESGVVGGPEVFELMQQPAFLNSGDTYDYGFGLHIRRYPNALAYEHGGGWAGFSMPPGSARAISCRTASAIT